MKQFTVFFLWMVAFKTRLDVIGKLTWIGKIMYDVIKYGLANTLSYLSLFIS